MVKWSTPRTRSLETIEQGVAVGRHLAPSETSQAVLRSLLHTHRCGTPNPPNSTPLTIICSCLGDLQHHSIFPIVSRLLLSTEANNLPLFGHLHHSLRCRSRIFSSFSRPEPLRKRQPLESIRIHTRRHLTLFGFISPPRACDGQPHLGNHMEGLR